MEFIIPGMTNHVMRALDSSIDEDLFDEDDVRAALTIPTIRCIFQADDFTEDEARVMYDIEAIGSSVVRRFREQALTRMHYDELADGIRLAIRIARLYVSGKLNCGTSISALEKNPIFGNAAIQQARTVPKPCLLDLLIYMRDILRDELAKLPLPVSLENR